MSELNGTGAANVPLPYVTELTLASGITVWVRPMSLNDQRLIREKLAALYPAPQERDYKIPVPADLASFEGQTMIDTDAFKAAQAEHGQAFTAAWLHDHVLTCVDFPEGVDAIIELYRPEIERKRRVLPLPADDLEAVLFHAVITSKDDENNILAAVSKTMPIEESEVRAQLRIFRPATQQRKHRAVSNGRKEPSGAAVVQEQTP